MITFYNISRFLHRLWLLFARLPLLYVLNEENFRYFSSILTRHLQIIFFWVNLKPDTSTSSALRIEFRTIFCDIYSSP